LASQDSEEFVKAKSQSYVKSVRYSGGADVPSAQRALHAKEFKEVSLLRKSRSRFALSTGETPALFRFGLDRAVLFFSFAACLVSLVMASPQGLSGRTASDPRSVSRFTGRPPLKLPLTAPRIVVRKSRRELLLFSGDKLVRTYHVGLGLNPVGDKVRSGDRRTPEGEFYVFIKNDKSQFYLSLGLSYPNAVHAERGLRDGLINRSQYKDIMNALRARERPLQNTTLGGDIFIHGNGASSDWTWGCVALENQDMRELFDAVEVGTRVVIEP
jgi:L,D-transpeptidase catalytic domain